MRNKYLFTTNNTETTPFTSAEEAWFWYCLCQQLGNNRAHNSEPHIIRPCESSDIFLAIKKLVRAGLLLPKHIKVLSKYGSQQVPPHPHFGDSLSICSLWQEALRFLESLLRRKGIVA
ncbi:MAG: hypothetical protein J6Y85_03670 [Alphaproteobacteria bacterium]|nr:hypothetical protein [Alphaproteobacteria bacterium]